MKNRYTNGVRGSQIVSKKKLFFPQYFYYASTLKMCCLYLLIIAQHSTLPLQEIHIFTH